MSEKCTGYWRVNDHPWEDREVIHCSNEPTLVRGHYDPEGGSCGQGSGNTWYYCDDCAKLLNDPPEKFMDSHDRNGMKRDYRRAKRIEA